MIKIRSYIKAPWILPLKICIPRSEVEEMQQAISYQESTAFKDLFFKNDLAGIRVS